VWQLPSRAEPTDDPGRRDPALRSLVPRARRPFAVRRLFASVADEGSVTEVPSAHARTFHLPVVAFIDHPGLLIGLEAERAGVLRAGCRALSAIYEADVWASVIVRRAYGAAGATHRNPARHTFRVAWPSGQWGSLPVQGGVDAAYRRVIESAEDPDAKRAELQRDYEQMTSPFRTAEMFGVDDIIDPAETRSLLCDWVHTAYHTMSSGPVGPSGRTWRA
jgi:acetyl-CoA carboxylase carboxyltransferase component